MMTTSCSVATSTADYMLVPPINCQTTELIVSIPPPDNSQNIIGENAIGNDNFEADATDTAEGKFLFFI